MTGIRKVNLGVLDWAVNRPVSDPASKALLMLCAYFCDEAGRLDIRLDALALLAGCHANTVREKLNYLGGRGLLTRTRVLRGEASGGVTRITLMPEVPLIKI